MTFLLALCQPGAERALKAEARAAGLASSFQRPGLVTFKSPHPIDVDSPVLSSRRGPVFARHLALSLGKVEGDPAAAVTQAGADMVDVVSLAEDQQDARALLERLAAGPAAPLVAAAQGERAADALVATLVLVDDVPWLTLHRHGHARTPFPAGRPPLSLPEDAPSRAWLKLEEAQRLFSIPFQAGERALELGASPGGAVKALLDRGLVVTGVDPNSMDEHVRQHPRFTHIRAVAMSVDPSALAPLHWVLLDVNIPPRAALRGALPFLAAHQRTLKGCVLTLKMKEWAMAAEIDGWLGMIRQAAPQLSLGARQLWSNGQEICVVGLRGDGGDGEGPA